MLVTASTRMTCYLYLALASDGSLYTGISGDPERRLREHNHGGRGARALRGKRPVSLLACFSCADRTEALRLEHRVKRLRAAEKWSLALGNLSERSRNSLA
jgi:putative endonuclease